MTQQITSITRGPRQSNFELLRIIAMFMVLILHANSHALGLPSAESIQQKVAHEVFRITFQCFAVVGVNVFVMISGWFGIRASLKGFISLWFQVIYFYFGSLIVLWALGVVPLSFSNLASVFCLNDNGWFIKSYSILYILSPVLNSFLETASKKKIGLFLLSFFAFETVFGIVNNAEFAHGYSALSFCGIYLLAGYCRKFGWRLSRKSLLVLYVGISLLNICINCFVTIFSIPGSGVVMYYCSPLVILPSIALVLWFSGLSLRPNRVINFIAASAFAVYLFHDFHLIRTVLFSPLVRYSDAQLGLLGVAIAIISIYAIAIILDQPRKWIWSYLKRFID